MPQAAGVTAGPCRRSMRTTRRCSSTPSSPCGTRAARRRPTSCCWRRTGQSRWPSPTTRTTPVRSVRLCLLSASLSSDADTMPARVKTLASWTRPSPSSSRCGTLVLQLRRDGGAQPHTQLRAGAGRCWAGAQGLQEAAHECCPSCAYRAGEQQCQPGLSSHAGPDQSAQGACLQGRSPAAQSCQLGQAPPHWLLVVQINHHRRSKPMPGQGPSGAEVSRLQLLCPWLPGHQAARQQSEWHVLSASPCVLIVWQEGPTPGAAGPRARCQEAPQGEQGSAQPPATAHDGGRQQRARGQVGVRAAGRGACAGVQEGALRGQGGGQGALRCSPMCSVVRPVAWHLFDGHSRRSAGAAVSCGRLKRSLCCS